MRGTALQFATATGCSEFGCDTTKETLGIAVRVHVPGSRHCLPQQPAEIAAADIVTYTVDVAADGARPAAPFEHGGEFAPQIVAAKYNAVEGAFRVLDRCLELSGGFGMFKKSELERLFRDCRAGRFHPANSALTHELLGKMALGINPDEQPRWG